MIFDLKENRDFDNKTALAIRPPSQGVCFLRVCTVCCARQLPRFPSLGSESARSTCNSWTSTVVKAYDTERVEDQRNLRRSKNGIKD